MTRKWLKTKIFHKYQLHKHPHLTIFGGVFQQSDLWHINRHSIPTGTAIGLFCAFIPVPFQMILAALIATIMRGNIPTAVMLVWVSNPLTWGPIFYACYKLGQTVLGIPPNEPEYGLNQDWFMTSGFFEVLGPMTLGGVIIGGFAAAIGYALVVFIWRWHIFSYLRRKRQNHR